MFKLRKHKLVNDSYLRDEIDTPIEIDEKTRKFIDIFVATSFERLRQKCLKINDHADDTGNCATDILTQCIISLYERKKDYVSQEDCNDYCESYINKSLRKIYERKRYIQRDNYVMEMANATEDED